MKRFLLVAIILLLPLLVACKEEEVISNAKLALNLADTFGSIVYFDLDRRHESGALTDDKWKTFLDAFGKFDETRKTMVLSLAEWEKMKGKPLMEKIVVLISDLDKLTIQIKALLQAWGITKTPGMAAWDMQYRVLKSVYKV